MSPIDDRAVAHVDFSLRRAGQLLVVRDDDQRRAVPIELPEQRDDLRARARVELSRRLVGEKNCRPIGECASDRNTLLLAA